MINHRIRFCVTEPISHAEMERIERQFLELLIPAFTEIGENANAWKSKSDATSVQNCDVMCE